MRISVLREVLLYRYRYIAGLLVFGVILAILPTIRFDLAPTGLSNVDMDSALRSATYKLTQPFAQSVVDLPYLLVQKLSMHVFGVTEFAIKLPSMIFGIASGAAFIMMVRRWFRLNIALVTSLIFVTSSAFLVLARSGNGAIMTTFWLSLFLLAATNIVHPEGKTRLWFIAAFCMVPFSLYTPLMIYPLIAIFIAGLLHPHVRFTLRHISSLQYTLGAIFLVLVLAPLGYMVITSPSHALELLGIPSHLLSWPELFTNLKTVVKSFLNIGNAVVGATPQPIFGAASFLIILLGLLQTIRDWYSARSYMLLIWATMFIPLAIFNPDKLLICLVPSYLFLAIGVETLIREWYSLFPFNPYARLAGVLPLTILIGGIMLSNSAQYFYGFFYGTPTTLYNEQLTATRRVLDTHNYRNESATVVARTSEVKFYDLLRRDYPKLEIAQSQAGKVTRPTIIHDGATAGSVGTPAKIVTSYKVAQDSVIVRLYTP